METDDDILAPLMAAVEHYAELHDPRVEYTDELAARRAAVRESALRLMAWQRAEEQAQWVVTGDQKAYAAFARKRYEEDAND